MRSMIRRCLLTKKHGHTRQLLGYTRDEFKAHLEALFLPGMTWKNRGLVWHLDHVREIAEFLKAGVSDPAAINALSNLQPLFVAEHKAKTRDYLRLVCAA